MLLLPLTRYRALKDKLLGPIGTPSRDQFEHELTQALADLARIAEPPRTPSTRKPRE